MRAFGQLLAVLMGFATAIPCGSLCSQDSPDPPVRGKDAGDGDSASARVQRSNLVTFYLRDKDGKLIPYVDIPYEEFKEVFDLYNKLSAPERPPRFILQRMSLNGTVQDGHASFDATFKVLTQFDGWVRVPLRFKHAVVRTDETRKLPESQIIEFDEAGAGYVCRIRGEVGKVHTVQLRLAVPVRQSADVSQIQLDMPRATTSQLELVVPESKIVADAGDDVLLHPPQPKNGKTKLLAEGLSGTFKLAWQSERESMAAPAPQLRVGTSVLVKFEGQSSIRCEAGIKVRSFGAPINSFLVRLPPGMKYEHLDQDGVDVRTLKQDEPQLVDLTADCQYVEVRFDNKASRPDEVKLRARLRAPDVQPDTMVELGGFEVVGVYDQKGTVSLAVDDGWFAKWQEGPRVNRLEEIPDSLRSQGVVARFSYGGGDYSLRAQNLRRPRRVMVEPNYVFRVDADQVVMTATLKYRLQGASVSSLTVDMPGWEVTQVVDNDDRVQTDAFDQETTTPFTIPLNTAAALQTEFELKITAVRAIEPDATSIDFVIPRPAATSVSAAAVVVMPADNVKLAPLDDDITHLTPDTLSPSMVLRPGRQQTLVYRAPSPLEDEQQVSRFTAEIAVLEQVVSATASATLLVSADRIDVTQQVDYQIDYVPLDELLLRVPRAALENESLKVALGQEPLDWSEIISDEATPAMIASVRVNLNGQGLGKCAITIRFSQALSGLSVGESVSSDVLLASPLDNEPPWSAKSVEIRHAEILRAEVTDDAWQGEQESSTDGVVRRIVTPQADTDVHRLPLTVTLLRVDDQSAALVHRAWIQTWFSHQHRQDRAAFRVTARDRRLVIRLPSAATLDDAAVDGRRVEWTEEVEGVVLELAASRLGSEVTIELWYSFANESLPEGASSILFPQIARAKWTKRLYWQLVIPSDQHLLKSPSDLTPELTWGWRGAYWGRQANLSQQELEQWVGASSQAALPSSANQYVFSTFGSVDQFELATVSRRSALLMASAIIFVVGLLLIYFRVARHPVMLLLLGVTVIAGAVLYPEPTLLAAQTASLGFVFVLAVYMLKCGIARTTQRQPHVRGTSAPSADVSSTQIHLPAPDGGSHSSANTGSLSIHVADSESA